MKTDSSVSNVTFKAAHAFESERGLLGHVSFVFGGQIRLRGVQLRRTADGRLTLSFPKDPRHPGDYFHRPIDDAARVALEEQVIGDVRRRFGEWFE